MRRVACVSTVIDAEQQDGNSSSRIIDIFNSSRTYNSDNQITGAFIVSGRDLLMIVEGEATVLANLVFKFRQDSRLKDFSLIQNVEIKEPEFTSWGMKTLKEGQGQSRFYEKLKRIFSHNLDLKSRLDEQRLDVFIGSAPSENDVSSSQSGISGAKLLAVARSKYEGEALSLNGWPKPGKIKLSPELIRVCARLVGKPQNYHALLSANIVENEEALLLYLRQLNRLGILRRHHIENDHIRVNSHDESNNAVPPDRFGSVLRNFLAAARR